MRGIIFGTIEERRSSMKKSDDENVWLSLRGRTLTAACYHQVAYSDGKKGLLV